MVLVNEYGQEYGGFVLDISKIKAAGPSLREDKVELPYTGKLPKQFDGCSVARVSLMARPFEVRISLKADRGDEPVFANVDAEPREVREILDQLFRTANFGKTGLAPFWEGTWAAHYVDWKVVLREIARTEPTSEAVNKP